MPSTDTIQNNNKPEGKGKIQKRGKSQDEKKKMCGERGGGGREAPLSLHIFTQQSLKFFPSLSFCTNLGKGEKSHCGIVAEGALFFFFWKK